MARFKISFHVMTAQPTTEADRLDMQVRCSGVVEHGVGVHRLGDYVTLVSAVVEAPNAIEAGATCRTMARASGLSHDMLGVVPVG